jgi:hypothetical protein
MASAEQASPGGQRRRLVDPTLRQRAQTTILVQSLTEANLESIVEALPRWAT